MWLVLITGGAYLIFFALLSMCIVAGWADEDMKRIFERGDSVECEGISETTEETGLHDNEQND